MSEARHKRPRRHPEHEEAMRLLGVTYSTVREVTRLLDTEDGMSRLREIDAGALTHRAQVEQAVAGLSMTQLPRRLYLQGLAVADQCWAALADLDDRLRERKTMRSGYLPERKGVHPALSFTYRPALATEAQDYRAGLNGSPEDIHNARVALVASHLLSWDVRDCKGVAVPISESVLHRVRYQALTALAGTILGGPTHA
jgi:hypothetical protein